MRSISSLSRRSLPVLLASLVMPLAVAAGCQRQANARAAAGTPNPAVPVAAVAAVPAASPPLPATPAPFASPPLLPGTPDVAALVAKVKPSVVNITTVHAIHGRAGGNFNFPFGFDPFGAGPNQRPRGGDQVFKQQALGSGFIADSRGHIVTNAHVVDDADEVKVKLADEKEYSAKVIGRDKRLDLAVLELEGATELPAAALGSSADLRVGEYVVAIGNPFGLGHTVTMGIVSAKDRAIGAGPYDDFIQTDASINPGNSGGPLFNLKGEVVGINTAINPNGRGIGFAIPVDALKDVLDPLVRTGHVSRGSLGVTIQRVDVALGKALGVGGEKGALISDVQPGTPAAQAGLKAGDVIISLDGAPVASFDDLPRMIARHAPGSRTKVEYLRAGKRETVDVVLAELKDEPVREIESGSAPNGVEPQGLGIEVGESSQRRGEVIVGRVMPGSAADGRLVSGDVILEVNRAPVRSPEDVANQVKRSAEGSPLLFKIRRQGNTLYVAVDRGSR
jgi:serine protease Do